MSERARIEKLIEAYAKMQRINRTGRRTIFAMCLILILVCAFWLLR